MANKTYNITTKEIEHMQRTYNIKAKSKADAKKKVFAGVVDWDSSEVIKSNIKIRCCDEKTD